MSPRFAVESRRCIPPSHSRRCERGSILLEVVLALALFVGAATVISTGINASVQAVYRLRLQTHAANLATSIISEMQMRARPVAPAGPESFEPPFDLWTYRIELPQFEDSVFEPDSLRPVEVIISHLEENVIHRLTQLFRASEIEAGSATEPEATFL